ncbi:hypothetical protein GGR28_002743 [Lewinella aquimaris]|uniref:WD40 repeat protein n=1 Tax=Neolewinella aquimaris TaxID=1835722 RepID=A0A840E861_9BACT|nr:PD40 domain-containing protein [Neolewinella aquimaris]MBB4080113.1 hypothetical protein [Neolewinella aquimaris]
MRSTLLLVFLCSLTNLSSQNIGLHPPEVDWQQLRGDHVRVIFPEGYEARARRAASLIDWMATRHTGSIGEAIYNFDLILQTPNMTINGYVGLAPFRSEFYVTPPQSFNLLSGTDWVDLLTIHEFRHVQQNSNERRGLTKVISYLQGQQGWAAFSAIATPNWFSEGDAVVAETALSASGRGRTPAFSKDLRALLQRDIVYRYAKARNGSFRDLVPDHYRYGYAMTTFARERFGYDVWKPVLQQAAAYRGMFYPFSRALRRETGYTTGQLYRATMADLEQRQDSVLNVDPPSRPGELIGGADRDIRNYRFPFMDEGGRLLALRSSYQRLPALVWVRPGQPDEVITTTGIQREPWLDGGARLVVWTEYRQDPRYTNQNYSDLIVYELQTGLRRKLSEWGHYVAGRLSADESRIAAVWFDPLEAGPELRILEVASGEVTQRVRIDANNVAWPAFSPDGRTVYFFAQAADGISIRAWEPASGAVEVVREASNDPVDMLTVTQDGALLYSGGRTGVDNVYRLDPATGQTAQLTDVAVGAYFPQLSGDTLYFSSPTPRGERLHQLAVAGPVAGIEGRSRPQAGIFERPVAYTAEQYDLPAEVVERDYPVNDFSNTLGGIKLHSWSYNGSYVTPGLSVEFANALNTFEMSVDGLYNLNEDRYSGGATLTYGGWFPVVQLQAQYRDRNTVVQEARTDSLRFFNQEFSQLTVGPTVTVPMQWVAGNTVTGLAPSVGYQYYALRDAEQGRLPDNFGNLALGVDFSSLRRTALRQVQPRLGATARLKFDRALGGDRLGERLLLQSSVYLPGLFVTHGLRLDLDVQREQSENLYQYPDVFRYARGYEQPLNDRVFRLGVNYQLPLLYPDIGLLGITYFKRVRLNAFYDYSRFAIDAFDRLEFTESSVGGQFFFDNTWLNTVDLAVGVELAYRLEQDLFSREANDLRVRLLFSGSF